MHLGVDASTSRFFLIPCYEFFSYYESFFPYFFHGSKNSNVQPALDAWKHMVFVHVLKNSIFRN